MTQCTDDSCLTYPFLQAHLNAFFITLIRTGSFLSASFLAFKAERNLVAELNKRIEGYTAKAATRKHDQVSQGIPGFLIHPKTNRSRAIPTVMVPCK